MDKKTYHAEWRAAHPGYYAVRQAIYRAAHPGLRRPRTAADREYNRTWYATRPEAKRHYEHRRRAQRQGTDLTPAGIKAMLVAAIECPLCGLPMNDTNGDPRQRNLDHIIPLGVGGLHVRANVRVICRDCNLRRPRNGRDV